MAGTFNQVTLVGNLGKDPEMSYTQEGTAFTKFSVAIEQGYGKQASTLWMNVTVWDKMAENSAQYLSRGKKVLVQGSLTVQKYTDKNGVERQSIGVRASSVVFLSAKDSATATPDTGELDETPF